MPNVDRPRALVPPMLGNISRPFFVTLVTVTGGGGGGLDRPATLHQGDKVTKLFFPGHAMAPLASVLSSGNSKVGGTKNFG